jgi:hypothetical protein
VGVSLDIRTEGREVERHDGTAEPFLGAPATRPGHLEAELEGLQDAVYRRALAEDEQIDDLRRRTAPDQLARDLSEDARRRGL